MPKAMSLQVNPNTGDPIPPNPNGLTSAPLIGIIYERAEVSQASPRALPQLSRRTGSNRAGEVRGVLIVTLAGRNIREALAHRVVCETCIQPRRYLASRRNSSPTVDLRPA